MVDVPMGSKYASGDNHQMTYSMKRTHRISGPLEKVDPEPLQIAVPMPKFIALVKNSFITN